GHNLEVQSLSWSPSGYHLTSRSDDGTILIQNSNQSMSRCFKLLLHIHCWAPE
ncbi:hypothetical protein BDR05DRAFT_895533, partial [Suillus weaverae]